MFPDRLKLRSRTADIEPRDLKDRRAGEGEFRRRHVLSDTKGPFTGALFRSAPASPHPGSHKPRAHLGAASTSRVSPWTAVTVTRSPTSAPSAQRACQISPR